MPRKARTPKASAQKASAAKSKAAVVPPKTGQVEGQATPQKKLPCPEAHSPAEIPATQPSPVPTPGQTPVKSPPLKKTRAETAAGIESQPTLILGDIIDVHDEIMEDRQVEEYSPAPHMSPLRVSPRTWMFSEHVSEIVHQILFSETFDGDVGSLADLREWPKNVPRTPLAWALEWKKQNYPVPFLWMVNQDEPKSSTIEMMASSARDVLISAQELDKQIVIAQEKFEKTCAVTDRLEEAKLSDLETKFDGQQLENAKKGISQWSRAQKQKAQSEMDTALEQHRRKRADGVEQVAALLRYMMESHDLIVAKSLPDLDSFLQDLNLELQSSLKESDAAEQPLACTPRVLEFSQVDPEPEQPSEVNGEKSVPKIEVHCFGFFVNRGGCSWDPFIRSRSLRIYIYVFSMELAVVWDPYIFIYTAAEICIYVYQYNIYIYDFFQDGPYWYCIQLSPRFHLLLQLHLRQHLQVRQVWLLQQGSTLQQ